MTIQSFVVFKEQINHLLDALESGRDSHWPLLLGDTTCGFCASLVEYFCFQDEAGGIAKPNAQGWSRGYDEATDTVLEDLLSMLKQFAKNLYWNASDAANLPEEFIQFAADTDALNWREPGLKVDVAAAWVAQFAMVWKRLMQRYEINGSNPCFLPLRPFHAKRLEWPSFNPRCDDLAAYNDDTRRAYWDAYCARWKASSFYDAANKKKPFVRMEKLATALQRSADTLKERTVGCEADIDMNLLARALGTHADFHYPQWDEAGNEYDCTDPVDDTMRDVGKYKKHITYQLNKYLTSANTVVVPILPSLYDDLRICRVFMANGDAAPAYSALADFIFHFKRVCVTVQDARQNKRWLVHTKRATRKGKKGTGLKGPQTADTKKELAEFEKDMKGQSTTHNKKGVSIFRCADNFHKDWMKNHKRGYGSSTALANAYRKNRNKPRDLEPRKVVQETICDH